jgi:tRNA(fMet)-specific endonuclease VapC
VKRWGNGSTKADQMSGLAPCENFVAFGVLLVSKRTEKSCAHLAIHSMRFLLDTCVLSDFARGDLMTTKRIREFSPTDIAVSTVTEMEIRYGLKLNPRLSRRLLPIFEQFFGAVQLLPFDSAAASATSELRASLKRRGTPVGAYDALIAGIALAGDLTLVTSNVSEFGRIPEIRIEDWRR